MKIRRPRGVTVPQLMIVTAIGFLGGVYIWKPLLTRYNIENKIGAKDELKQQQQHEQQEEPENQPLQLTTRSGTSANTMKQNEFH